MFSLRLTAEEKKSPSIRREWIEINLQKEIQRIRESPSIRREWIEIQKNPLDKNEKKGLPPYGGSGLKSSGGKMWTMSSVSPSIRREWIEM